MCGRIPGNSRTGAGLWCWAPQRTKTLWWRWTPPSLCCQGGVGWCNLSTRCTWEDKGEWMRKWPRRLLNFMWSNERGIKTINGLQISPYPRFPGVLTSWGERRSCEACRRHCAGRGAARGRWSVTDARWGRAPSGPAPTTPASDSAREGGRERGDDTESCDQEVGSYVCTARNARRRELTFSFMIRVPCMTRGFFGSGRGPARRHWGKIACGLQLKPPKYRAGA